MRRLLCLPLTAADDLLSSAACSVRAGGRRVPRFAAHAATPPRRRALCAHGGEEPARRAAGARRGAGRRSRLAVELQRCGVDAVAQARRRRAILEDVAEVAAAGPAEHLGAPHTVADVGLGVHPLSNRNPEARPARPRVELLVRAEQRLAAAGAAVGALVLGVGVLAGERSLRALLAQHVVLLRRELRPPLRVRLLHSLCHRLTSRNGSAVILPPRPDRRDQAPSAARNARDAALVSDAGRRPWRELARILQSLGPNVHLVGPFGPAPTCAAPSPARGDRRCRRPRHRNALSASSRSASSTSVWCSRWRGSPPGSVTSRPIARPGRPTASNSTACHPAPSRAPTRPFSRSCTPMIGRGSSSAPPRPSPRAPTTASSSAWSGLMAACTGSTRGRASPATWRVAPCA